MHERDVGQVAFVKSTSRIQGMSDTNSNLNEMRRAGRSTLAYNWGHGGEGSQQGRPVVLAHLGGQKT
jgi:hypothetical protein